MSDALAEQLAEEMDRALTGSVRALLGLDLADVVAQRIADRAPMLATQLAQTDDDELAAETVVDVMGLLWPHGVTDPDWWRTALGRVCARSLALADAEEVTHAHAAAMLGVTRGTIAQMVSRGTLDRHPDGGILRSSVLARLGR